jgi:hypothetical protein
MSVISIRWEDWPYVEVLAQQLWNVSTKSYRLQLRSGEFLTSLEDFAISENAGMDILTG